MIMAMIRRRCPRAAGLFLLAGGMLLVSGGVAQAQLNPQDLLKQVLPGVTSRTPATASPPASAPASAMPRSRASTSARSATPVAPAADNLEVMLSVEDRDDRYDARCIYDTKDQEVRELVPSYQRHRARSRTARSSERLAQRAQNACEELAEDRDLEDVDFDEARARGHDTVEIDLRARVRGERQNLTCLYDDDQRHAVLAE